MLQIQQTQNSDSIISDEEGSPKLKKKQQKNVAKIATGHLNVMKVNLKKIIINVSDTQYPVVSEVAEQLDWKIQTKSDATNWDVFWTDSAILPDILFRMHFFQKVNHYPGIHIIARKNLLGLNLMAMRQKFQQQYNFFPLTWMLPSQYGQFREYFQTVTKGKARTYIVKPEADCQGRGIFLTRNIQDLVNGNHYVVQRYITKPFLIDSLKFDFRIYVLLAGTQPLRVYLFNQGLARFATQLYQEPNSENMDNMCMHLTNYAINKLNSKFVFNNSEKDMGIGHKRSLSSVYKYLQKKGYNVKQLKEKIKDIIIKTFITGLPLISHQYRYCQPEQYSGNMCFHILGFDIMLTNQFQPVLLQVNHTPSFTTDTPLDQYIKHNVIKDTLILMNINQKTKEQLFKRAKECNSQRLFTGKRRIFQGAEKEQQILKAQKQRDLYQAQHMGGFEKIHPVQDQKLMKKYTELIQYANKICKEENTLRGKIFKQQRLKLRQQESKIKKSEKINKKYSEVIHNKVQQCEKQKSNFKQTKQIKRSKLFEIINLKLQQKQRPFTSKMVDNKNLNKVNLPKQSKCNNDVKTGKQINQFYSKDLKKDIRQQYNQLQDNFLNFIKTQNKANIFIHAKILNNNIDKFKQIYKKDVLNNNFNKRNKKILSLNQSKKTLQVCTNQQNYLSIAKIQEKNNKQQSYEKLSKTSKIRQKIKSSQIQETLKQSQCKLGIFLVPKLYDIDHESIFQNRDSKLLTRYHSSKKKKLIEYLNRDKHLTYFQVNQ